MGEIGTLTNSSSVLAALSAEMRKRTNNMESVPSGFFRVYKSVTYGADEVLNFSDVGDRINFFTLPDDCIIIGGYTTTPDIENVTASSTIGLFAGSAQLTISIVGTASKKTYLDTIGSEEINLLGNAHDASGQNVFLEITGAPSAFNSDAPKTADVMLLIYIGEEITI